MEGNISLSDIDKGENIVDFDEYTPFPRLSSSIFKFMNKYPIIWKWLLCIAVEGLHFYLRYWFDIRVFLTAYFCLTLVPISAFTLTTQLYWRYAFSRFDLSIIQVKEGSIWTSNVDLKDAVFRCVIISIRVYFDFQHGLW